MLKFRNTENGTFLKLFWKEGKKERAEATGAKNENMYFRQQATLCKYTVRTKHFMSTYIKYTVPSQYGV
jgi:hypothetical protein